MDWDQWQPQTDTTDIRLDQRLVSLWSPAMSVADVLARAAEQTDVTLLATDYLVSIRVSLFARDATIGGVMVALARLFDGYWMYRRGERPELREYCLTARVDPLEWDSLHGWDLKRERAEAALQRPTREDRLAQYAGALELAPAELLAEHERDDPWLCAVLLDPRLRPMVEQVYSLSDEARDELLRDGRVELPLRSFAAAFRQHLALWAQGRGRNQPGGTWDGPDPDRLPRFSTPEERWDNASVRFWWGENCLQLHLSIPDVGRFDANVLQPASAGPYSARGALSRLGYREATPEYVQAAKAEADEWEQRREERRKKPNLPYAAMLPPPDDSDPRLEKLLDLSAAEDATAAGVLALIAEQSELVVVANYMPRQVRRLAPSAGSAAEAMIGDVLKAMRAARGGTISWEFRGRYLIVKDADYPLTEARALPQAALATWGERVHPGATLSLADIVSLLPDLNPLQMAELTDTIMPLSGVPSDGLRLYGLLSDAQRTVLSSPEGLRQADLIPRQSVAVSSLVRRSHPWLQSPDLSDAVLRTIPRKLSTGQDGMSFIIEYHFPDSPNDRDVLFTLPLAITIPKSSQ